MVAQRITSRSVVQAAQFSVAAEGTESGDRTSCQGGASSSAAAVAGLQLRYCGQFSTLAGFHCDALSIDLSPGTMRRAVRPPTCSSSSARSTRTRWRPQRSGCYRGSCLQWASIITKTDSRRFDPEGRLILSYDPQWRVPLPPNVLLIGYATAADPKL